MKKIITREAPELAYLPVLAAALDSFDAWLVAEHPTITELQPAPPPTLHNAILVRASIATLRQCLMTYRRSVVQVIRPKPRANKWLFQPGRSLPF